MKKALVIAFMMVLGLGLFASAQTWEGTWDTDISIVPSAVLFSDFIGFDSDITVTMSVGGWDFTMDADLSTAGMDGLGFDATGVIGAFSFVVDLDFAPMLLSKQVTTYTEVPTVQTGGACVAADFTWDSGTKTVVSTYGPAFDDLTLEGSVSIAGLSFSGLFYLKGTDMDGSTTYSSWAFTTTAPKQFSQTTGADAWVSTTTFVVPGTTKVGTGAKFTISGSFAGATVTNYTFFNLTEYSDWDVSSYDTDYLATKLQLSGVLSGLACPGCDIMFTRNYTLIEGLSPFGDCLTVDLAIDFSCCDFEGISILFKDISLGCCWDLKFDFLIEFATASKTMTLEPGMTFANGCFTIAAEVTYGSATNLITGIQLEGLSYSHTFNGVTVAFYASWDASDYPLISYNSLITHYGADKVFFWVPDTHRVSAGKRVAAVDNDGKGYYVLDSAYCSKQVATVINKLSLDFDADGCCGGLFDLDVDTYFGSILDYTLVDVFGTYYADTTCNGTFDIEYDFLGTDNEYVADGGNKAPTACSAGTDGTPCDPCFTAATFKDYNGIEKDYGSGTALGSMLGWVKTAADISFGVGSNITIDLGIDVAWYGWDSLSFGVTFTW